MNMIRILFSFYSTEYSPNLWIAYMFDLVSSFVMSFIVTRFVASLNTVMLHLFVFILQY